MSFKLVISDTVVVAVAGKIPTASGGLQQFNFNLVCKRLNTTDLREELAQKDRPIEDFIRKVATGWDGVLDADGQPLPFSDEGLTQLLNVAGIPGVAFQAYLESVGARGKEKN